MQCAKKSPALKPDFKSFFDRYFRVLDHPLGSPYIRPFISNRPTSKNLWFNENVAGSYAPSSIRPGQPFRRVVDVVGNHYTLKDNHERLALEHLLEGEPLSLTDIGTVLLRERGFLAERPTLADVRRALGVEFGGAQDWRPTWAARVDSAELDDPSGTFLPFAEADAAVDVIDRSGPATAEAIRPLKAAELRIPEVSVDPHPCLRRLRVDGLLSFGERTEFRFGKLNVLVGANGAGKSNLIDCIRVLRSTADDDENIQKVFNPTGLDGWLFAGGGSTAKSADIEAEVAVEGVWLPLKHNLRISPAPHHQVKLEETINAVDREDSLLFASSTATLRTTGQGKRVREDQLPDEDYDPTLSILNQKRDLTAYPEITRLQRLYSKWRIYSEWSFGRGSELREPTPAGGAGGPLSESMENLASAISAIEGTMIYEKRLKPLLSKLKETYQDVRARPVIGRVVLELIEGQFKSGIPAERLSDGTLRFLAMAAILFNPDPPPLICLEEPELGMHPDAIQMVADMIADASERSQLIVTTHSEHLLTALEARFDVLLAFDTGPSGSVVHRLERDEFERWRADHALGELWASGELGGVRF